MKNEKTVDAKNTLTEADVREIIEMVVKIKELTPRNEYKGDDTYMELDEDYDIVAMVYITYEENEGYGIEIGYSVECYEDYRPTNIEAISGVTRDNISPKSVLAAYDDAVIRAFIARDAVRKYLDENK